MAVKWAIANGAWNAGATWNDGVVPTTDDSVYLNGYVVTLNVATIEVKELRSDSNTENNISDGGRLTTTNGYTTIVCEKVVQGIETDYFINKTNWTNSRWLQINGDVYTSEQASLSMIHISSGANHVLINGNIYLRGGYFLSSMQKHLTVNGNIISLVQMPHPFCNNNSAGGCTFSVNGIIDFGAIRFEQTENITLTINGVVKNAVLYATPASYFSGEYQYEGLPAIKLPMNFSQDYRFVAINEEVPILVNPNTIAQTYPPENKVLAPTQYGAQMELVGSYTPDYPPESVVLKDYEYGDSDARKTGTMVQEVNVEVGCVTPEDVRKDVPLVGMGVVGTLVVPSVDDVREGVVFDNGSVGTLIVQGGGNRLRIADFGYYTRSTSITYIVDLTESDKPAFADCEEIVLRSLFPTLDLDNIPDKFFDDLFVQFLRYRLLVEYYRGTSINSKFTPSEPTAEIVNYANTKCEYWLNTANLFLQLWGEKYPNSVKKDRIIL